MIVSDQPLENYPRSFFFSLLFFRFVLVLFLFLYCLDLRSKLHVNLPVICSLIQQLVFEFLVYTLPIYFSTVLDFAKEIKMC